MYAGKGARPWYLLLVVAATALLVVLVWPFVSALFVASVLAGALYPLTERLTRAFRGHRQVAAAVVTTGVIVVIIVPIATAAGLAAVEIVEGVQYIQATFEDGGDLEALALALPPRLERWALRLLAHVPDMSFETLSAEQGGRAAAAVGGLVTAMSSAVLQAVFMLIMLFFLLVDGRKLLTWLDEISPLKRGQLLELLLEFRNVSRSVISSSLITSAVQSITALVGYLVADAPRPYFFALVTFFFGFVPAFGAAGVVLTLALFTFFVGHPWAALFLALWGVLVVGLVDNIVKPWLLKSDMHLHGVVVFFSLIGGLAVFGAVGLIGGPLVMAFFVAVVRLARRELGSGPPMSEAGPVMPPPTDLPPPPAP